MCVCVSMHLLALEHDGSASLETSAIRDYTAMETSKFAMYSSHTTNTNLLLRNFKELALISR